MRSCGIQGMNGPQTEYFDATFMHSTELLPLLSLSLYSHQGLYLLLLQPPGGNLSMSVLRYWLRKLLKLLREQPRKTC